MLDCDEYYVARSIPDAVALLLNKLIDRKVTEVKMTEASLKCPECGSPLEMISGCEYCFSCGYSPCK